MLLMIMYWVATYITYYKENAEALVVVREEIGLEVNVDKSKNMIMSQDQNAKSQYKD